MAGPLCGMTDAPDRPTAGPCPSDDRDQRPKVGVVLLTAGGPDRDSAIEPFLVRYFSDPVNLGVPATIRPLFARVMARRRRRAAQRFYSRKEAGSPAGAAAEALAAAVQTCLMTNECWSYRVVAATRYWQPGCVEAATTLAEAGVERVIAIPLSPIEGRATTRSWLSEWAAVWPAVAGDRPQIDLTDLGSAEPVLGGMADIIRRRPQGDRVLMVAPGVRTDGAWRRDPYAGSARRVAAMLADRAGLTAAEWALGFTGTAGPIPFTDPPAESLIRAVAEARDTLSILPLGTVIETAETALGLDLDLVPFALDQGITQVTRLPVLADSQGGAAAIAAAIVAES